VLVSKYLAIYVFNFIAKLPFGLSRACHNSCPKRCEIFETIFKTFNTLVPRDLLEMQFVRSEARKKPRPQSQSLESGDVIQQK